MAPKISVEDEQKLREVLRTTGMTIEDLDAALDDGDDLSDEGVDASTLAAIKAMKNKAKDNFTEVLDTNNNGVRGVNRIVDTDTRGGEDVGNTNTSLTSDNNPAQNTFASQLNQAAQQAQAAQAQQQMMQQQQQAWAYAAQQQQAALAAAGQQQRQIDPAQVRALLAEIQGNGSRDNGSASTGDRPEGSTQRLEPSGKDNLDPSEVTFEKVGGGAMDDAEATQVILDALDLNGIPDDPEVRQKWVNVYLKMALHESGMDPDAGNGWDSNAHGEQQSDGLPFNSSRGMWQCIPTTFAAHHVAGTSTSIYDPVASAAASVNYIMDRYDISPEGDGLDSFASDRGIDANSGEQVGAYKGY